MKRQERRDHLNLRTRDDLGVEVCFDLYFIQQVIIQSTFEALVAHNLESNLIWLTQQTL